MEIIDRVKEWFGFDTDKPAKDVFLLVREGRYGIETYINPACLRFNTAYKKQIKEFLEGAIKELK